MNEKNKVQFEICQDEMRLIGNSLNEVCNGFKVENFYTVIGANIEVVTAMLKFLSSIYYKIKEIEDLDDYDFLNHYNYFDEEKGNLTIRIEGSEFLGKHLSKQYLIKAIDIKKDKVLLEMSIDEMQVLINAITVVYNTIEEWEFETRLGNTTQEAKDLLESMYLILNQSTKK